MLQGGDKETVAGFGVATDLQVSYTGLTFGIEGF